MQVRVLGAHNLETDATHHTCFLVDGVLAIDAGSIATTLARDVGRLSPDYCVKRLLLIDALPQTHHVEVLCVLEPGRST